MQENAPPREGGGRDSSADHYVNTHEKEGVARLLSGLCRGVEWRLPSKKRARRILPHMPFSIIWKVYSQLAARPLEADLRQFRRDGLNDFAPSHSSVLGYMKLKQMTPYLHWLIAVTASELKDREYKFAVDSTVRYKPTYYEKVDDATGKKERRRGRLKLHLICGAETFVITAARVTRFNCQDIRMFRPLFAQTLETGFKVGIIFGDEAYWSPRLFEFVRGHKAVPIITPKMMHKRKGVVPADSPEGSRERNAVETVNSMLRAKFRKELRSMDRLTQENELLSQVVCHNLRVLYRFSQRRGLVPTFLQEG